MSNKDKAENSARDENDKENHEMEEGQNKKENIKDVKDENSVVEHLCMMEGE
uniref:Uncharacterized protein n=1 Tax=Heterorhabditis bacteriophora TaxID=37862 RepID=A0A1I7WYW6_HETBA